ncbi:hypothetical protein ABZ070_07470 [Streptomyces sp. NPDC006283]|uniref:RICIN domain-containing protein n=1 Tax=Streptomyces sp. NPDC006283 TaxID=3156741 RepID=UPI0033AFF9DE
MKHFRTLLSLAASAAAVVVQAAPAHAVVPDGTFIVRDVGTGQCLAPAGEGPFAPAVLGDCAEWNVTGLGDDLVRITEVGSEQRCLGVAPLQIHPPLVDAVPCLYDTPTEWRLEGPAEGPLDIVSPGGTECVQPSGGPGSRMQLGDCEAPRFVLEPTG